MSKTIPSQDPYSKRNAKLSLDPTCSKCGQTKTVSDFPERDVCYWCNDCRRVYAIELYHKRRSKLSSHELMELRRKVNIRQKRNRERMLARMSQEERDKYVAKMRESGKRSRAKAKDAAYMAYGGYRCACCGEAEPMFLSIDHINNDGHKHRRENNIRTGEQMYRWLAKNNFPPGFQVLCMNCQWGKRNNNGVCPHTDKV